MRRTPARAIGRAVSCLAVACFIGSAFAQTYATRPPRLIVPYVAGGIADFIGRVIAEAVQEPLGVAFIIENRGGAGGNVGASFVAKSAPDGYTLGFVCLGFASNAALQSKIPYDPVKDFVPITMVGSSPSVIVIHPSLPVKTLPEFVALAKRRPGDLAYGSSGPGTGSHLAVELFAARTTTELTHIPYKGTAQALPDLVAGRIQFMFDFPTVSMPYIKTGKLRPLAITSLKRSEALPEVPTVAEAGLKGYEFGTWCGIVAPAGLPAPITERLNTSLVKALDSPSVRNRLAAQAIQVTPSSPQQFGAFIRNDIERWRRLVRDGRLQMLD